MNHSKKVVGLVIGGAFLLMVLIVPFAHATSQYDSVAIQSPAGTTISGTYAFTAIMVVGSGDTYSNAKITIDSTAYTATVSLVFSHSAYSEYHLTYNYVTGLLANGGPYSWSASATIGGQVFSASSTFYIHNTIGIQFLSPVSGSSVRNTVTVTVKESPSSSNTVTSSSLIVSGASSGMSPIGNGEYQGSFNSLTLPNGLAGIEVTATGTDSTSGSANETVNVANTGPSYWESTYDNVYGTYTTPDYPIMTPEYNYEGQYPMQLGSLPVYPNILTKSLSIVTPDTLSGIQTYYLPIDQTPYYNMTSKWVANWTDQSANRLYGNFQVGNNSPYSTPSITFGASPELNATETLTASDISASAWTIGFLLMATGNFTIGGVSALSPMITGRPFGDGYKIALDLFTSSDGQASITSNQTLQYGQWYAVTYILNKTTISSLQAYRGTSLYIDGALANTTDVVSVPSGTDFLGFTALLMNYTVTSYTEDLSLAGIYLAAEALTASGLTQMGTPAPWQIYSQIQPPLYSVSANYYGMTVTNGTQPWSSVGLQVENLQPQLFGSLLVSYQSALGPQSFLSFNLAVSYTPYLSTKTYNLGPQSATLSLPVLAKVNMTVTNEWGQVVGTLDNYVLNSTSATVSIYLDLSLLSFTFDNASTGQVTLIANGIPQTEFGQTIVANNSVYEWSTVIFANGNSTTLSGSVSIDTLTYNLVIYAPAPPVELTVGVFAYNESGQGAIGSIAALGEPYVNLYLDGQIYPTGQSFSAPLDSVVNITITDEIGQILYQSNYTLLNQQNNLVIHIARPSWILGLTNKEQAQQGSKLATETIQVNSTVGHYNGTFTDQVGMSLYLYLLQGNYTLYLHDNATFHSSIVLDQSLYYDIFGQGLVNYTSIAQNISLIVNNTAHLDIGPIRQQSTVIAGAINNFSYALTTPGGGALTQQEVFSLISNTSFALYNSTSNSEVQASLGTGGNNTIYASFTLNNPGMYNLLFEGYVSINGTIYSVYYPFAVDAQNPGNFSKGVAIQVEGAPLVQLNTPTNYTVDLTYTLGADSGRPLNLTDTRSVLANMTVAVFLSSVFQVDLPVTYVGPGVVSFQFTGTKVSDSYTVSITIAPTKLGPGNASAQQQIAIGVVSYNPTQGPPNSLQFLYNNLTVVVTVLSAASMAIVFIRWAYKRTHLSNAVWWQMQVYMLAEGWTELLTPEEKALLVLGAPKAIKRDLQRLNKRLNQAKQRMARANAKTQVRNGKLGGI